MTFNHFNIPFHKCKKRLPRRNMAVWMQYKGNVQSAGTFKNGRFYYGYMDGRYGGPQDVTKDIVAWYGNPKKILKDALEHSQPI